MGWLEYIIVTPSQHRVHHAINPEYIDKNLGQILSIWDRMFGTFQEELPNVPPQYGVLKPAATWNPILINFQHLWRLLKDAWRTKSWWDKLRIWFMPTGWRPKDIAEKYPVTIIEDVYNFEKYQPKTTNSLKGYAIFQMLSSTLLMLFMFYNYSEIGFNRLLLFGAFVFVGIYGYSTLMDKKKYAFWIELFRASAGITLIIMTGDWFGMNNYSAWGSIVMIAYFLITISGGLYFTFFESPAKPQQMPI